MTMKKLTQEWKEKMSKKQLALNCSDFLNLSCVTNAISGDCIYERETCNGAQNTTGWHPAGTLHYMDGSDEV